MNRSKLRVACLQGIALLLLLPAIAHAQALGGAGPAHLRLVWTEDPAHRTTVSWSTSSAGKVHEVYYDTHPRAGVLTAYAHRTAAARNGTYQSGGPYYHHAELTGLSPSSTYYFVVVSDGVASPERHFVTAHVDDRDFRMLFGGDSRSGISDRRKMNQRMARLTEADPGVVALAHGGDFVATGSSWSDWNSWLEDHALTFTSAGRVLPLIPTRGNHEGDGVLFNRIFGFPGGTELDYFVTQLGANVSFITLDSNTSLGGTQRSWLEQQLKEAQAGRWIVPSYHKPAYPAVKTPGSALQFWVPLFEKYNADLVCESDGHVLKRTVPIRAGKQDPTGVVYVGEGGLGVSQRSPISAWYLRSPGMARAAHHVQVLSFSPTKLVYEARLMDGSLADRYELLPKRNPAPKPPPAEAPVLSAVEARTGSAVSVTFSVDMEPASTASLGAYEISGGVAVLDAAMESPRTALLTTAELTPEAEYVLTVRGVRSAAGVALANPASASFRAPSKATEPPVGAPGDGADPGEDPEPDSTDPGDPAGEEGRARAGCAAAGGALGWVGVMALIGALRRRRRGRRASIGTGAFVVLASLGLSSNVLAKVVWRGDFETGDIKQWTRAQMVSSDRLQVVTSPVGQGRYALKTTVRRGDDPISSSGNRNELVHITDEAPGSEYYYRWQTMFAPDYPSSDGWQLFLQWHHHGSGGSPPLQLYVVGEELRLRAGGSGAPIQWRGKLVRGKWLDFILRVKWSSDPSVGFVELYLDGERVLPKRMARTMFSGQLNYLKMGLYRDESIQPVGVVFHDGMTMATTLEDVLDAPVAGPPDAGAEQPPVEPPAGEGPPSEPPATGEPPESAGPSPAESVEPPADQPGPRAGCSSASGAMFGGLGFLLLLVGLRPRRRRGWARLP